MGDERKHLLGIIDRFANTPMLVLGDIILDHYVWGTVSRISPEAPVVVVHVTKENECPGGSGNVANNLVALGAKVSLCGVVGDDSSGRAMIKQFDELRIDASSVLVDRSRCTTVKTRVIAQAQQVVRVDREDTHPLAKAYLDGLCGALSSHLSSVKGIVVSDYAKGVVTPQLFQVITNAYAEGKLGYGKVPVIVDPKPPNFDVYNCATVVKPNRTEAEQASGLKIVDRKSAIQAARKLRERWNAEMILVTLGELGMVLVGKVGEREEIVEVPTVARDVYDVSGAGDTVSAVFSLTLAVGGTATDAAKLANFAAGIVVAEVGTVAVTAEELRKVVKEGF